MEGRPASTSEEEAQVYGIIHDSIFSSSLLDSKRPNEIHTAYVFMCLCTIADPDDNVIESRDVLCAMFRVTRETMDSAVSELEAPDPRSRTKEHEGRRLLRLDARRDWGWHVINRDRYKHLRTTEDRRDYMSRLYQDVIKPKRKRHNKSAVVSNRQQSSAESAQAVGRREEGGGSRKETEEKDKDSVRAGRTTRQFQKPSAGELTAYCRERRNRVDPQRFLDHYESNGWKVGRNPMKDWKAAVRTWERTDLNGDGPAPEAPRVQAEYSALEKARADRLAWEREQETEAGIK
jgi:hypothetical protein